MDTETLKIRNEALALARDAGYSSGSFPPGRFEGEPFYVAYFYDMVMNGGGESFYHGDTVELDLFPVDECDARAFELAPSTVAVAVTYSDVGFIGIVELDMAEVARLESDEYGDNEEDSQS